jgi:hypothetical protein
MVGPAGPKRITVTRNLSLLTYKTIITPAPPPAQPRQSIYEGSVDGHPGSQVVLYVVKGTFVSGYLYDTEDGWNFIEPVRPLLKLMVRPENPNSSFTYDDVKQCIPAGTHIVYKAADTQWRIILDPAADSTAFAPTGLSVQKAVGLGLASSAHNHVTFTPSSHRPHGPIKVTLVGDYAFYNAYQNGTPDPSDPAKTWEEAQEEVLSAVDELYTDPKNFPPPSGQTSDFTLVAVEAPWQNQDGPGIATEHYLMAHGNRNINAFELLCEFAESTVVVPGAPRAPSGGWLHIHSSTEDTLVFLFSGQQMDGTLPSSQNGHRNDSGGFCSASCGTTDLDLKGFAEGIGGLSESSPTTSYCDDLGEQGQLDSQNHAHHALSQEIPNTSSAANQGTSPPQASVTSAWKYQGLLLQRIMLAAHEFGHVLGAMHDDPTAGGCFTIMCPVLNNSILPQFSASSVGDINKCLNSSTC